MRNKSIVLFLGVLSACATQNNTQSNLEKELNYIQNLQKKHSNLQPQFVNIPTGIIQIHDSVPCPDFSLKEISSKGGKISINTPCPTIKLNIDSIVRNSTLYNAALIDERAAQLKIQKTEGDIIILKQESNKYYNQRNKAYITIIAIIASFLLLRKFEN